MKDLPKDLEFLAKTVTEWPDPMAKTIRLDSDGEICFRAHSIAHDFYPSNTLEAKACYVGDKEDIIGETYTIEEWQQARIASLPTQPLADPLEGLLAAIKEPLEGVLDHVVVYALQEQLKVVEGQPLSAHQDDIDYNKKLVKALKRVLHYYGIQG